MKEYRFLKSIAGPSIKHNRGDVVTLSDNEAKSYLNNGIVELYDDHVKKQKAKARKTKSNKKTPPAK